MRHSCFELQATFVVLQTKEDSRLSCLLTNAFVSRESHQIRALTGETLLGERRLAIACERAGDEGADITCASTCNTQHKRLAIASGGNFAVSAILTNMKQYTDHTQMSIRAHLQRKRGKSPQT